MTIKYNTPIEVTEKQYHKIRIGFSGIAAHRQKNRKYWVKLLVMKYKDELENALTK